MADIAAGRVLVAGAVAERAARLVDPSEPLVVTGPGPRYVGRGGHKLEAALDAWPITVEGRRAIDVGSSTGGFTDCLLQRGAASVVAVDVGRGQLDARLRTDRRVEVHERTNIRHTTLDQLGGRPFPILVADLSFISLRTVAPALLGLCAPAADLVVLVKPQFEAGRAEASRGRGVIRDPAAWALALRGVEGALRSHGAAMMGVMASPLTGADGNVEFLLHATAPGGPSVPDPVAVDAAVDAAIDAGRTLARGV